MVITPKYLAINKMKKKQQSVKMSQEIPTL